MVLTINLWFFLIGSSVLLVVPWFFIFVSCPNIQRAVIFVSCTCTVLRQLAKAPTPATRIASLLLCGWFANGAISRGQIYLHARPMALSQGLQKIEANFTRMLVRAFGGAYEFLESHTLTC
ncbi:hypothetical protein P692DRAFT_20820034 [Suillus brevipes Sb2]|nr:hypothetical protein P692DRAFT_20820034 [Suillus brevipes Sb2]